MASDSNRTRIDEFFPARKRKPTLPAVKSERVNKDARTSVNGSSGSKGTLDRYLLSSQNENAKVVSSRQQHIKKNLSLGIKKSSQVEQKHDLPSKSSQLDEGLSRVSENVGEVPKEENSGSRPGEHNPELKKFAADFLSLYCSEVPSNVSSSSELKFNGQKRDCNPSLLVANGDKKQCVAHYDQRPLEGAVACSSQESDELNSEYNSRVREVVFSTSKKLGGTSDYNPSKLQAGLIKCNKTSASPARVECYTPGPSASPARVECYTPGPQPVSC